MTGVLVERMRSSKSYCSPRAAHTFTLTRIPRENNARESDCVNGFIHKLLTESFEAAAWVCRSISGLHVNRAVKSQTEKPHQRVRCCSKCDWLYANKPRASVRGYFCMCWRALYWVNNKDRGQTRAACAPHGHMQTLSLTHTPLTLLWVRDFFHAFVEWKREREVWSLSHAMPLCSRVCVCVCVCFGWHQ